MKRGPNKRTTDNSGADCGRLATMHEVLFIRDRKGDRSLREVADEIFTSLSIGVFEERESSNYRDGFYLVGHAANVAVKVCYGDLDEMADYRYWVVLESQVRRKDVSTVIDSRPSLVATKMAYGGFDVFIPSPGWGRLNWNREGTHYYADDRIPKNA